LEIQYQQSDIIEIYSLKILTFEKGENQMLNCKFQSKKIGLLLLCVFTTLLFTSNVVAQQIKLVEAIDIQGNRRLADEELLRHIKTRLGEQFDAKQAQKDLQSLLKLGLFNTSKTRVLTEDGVRGGVHVIFEVMELPLIVELNFDGLRYAATEELLAELREQKAEIAVNSPYQPEKLRKARNIITEYLVKKRGFVDAKVEVVEEVTATNMKISFIIDEMPNDVEENCCEK
jgi:outer membrane protein assembly factor BamA